MQRPRLIAIAGTIAALAAVGFIVPADDAAPGVAPARTAAPAASPVDPPAEPVVVAAAVEGATRAPALAVLTGSASYYADMFEGRTTASGVPFRQARMWAAHRTLPFGTRLRVTNLANGNEVEVEVVDRGPFAHGRVLDLSKAAARRLDFIRAGHTRVRIEVLARP